jgi:hypothetical protein
MTFALAFLPNVPMRVFLLSMTILCQFIALIWYTLSFIPFARQFIRSYVNNSSFCSCFHSQNVRWLIIELISLSLYIYLYQYSNTKNLFVIIRMNFGMICRFKE